MDNTEKLEKLMEEHGLSPKYYELGAVQAYIDLLSEEDLKNFEDSYSGTFKSDEDFAYDMAENCGDLDTHPRWPYTCIDWKHAASELMHDYSEQDGHYFRNY